MKNLISQKMLAQWLRRLEHDGLLTRTIYDEIPRAWIAAHSTGPAASSSAG
ncbi:winged helix-turn-helix transcriptional regulator [Pseudomonas sp. S2_H01]